MPQSLRIGIDGRGIYKTIGRYGLNLIKNLAAIDNANQYVILKNRQIGKIVNAKNFKEIEIDFRHL